MLRGDREFEPGEDAVRVEQHDEPVVDLGDRLDEPIPPICSDFEPRSRIAVVTAAIDSRTARIAWSAYSAAATPSADCSVAPLYASSEAIVRSRIPFTARPIAPSSSLERFAIGSVTDETSLGA